MALKRSQFITLCLWITILVVGSAVTLRMLKSPPGGKPGGDALVLLSPLFFGMAAKKASHLGKAATVMALVGVVFGGLALWAAITSTPPPALPPR